MSTRLSSLLFTVMLCVFLAIPLPHSDSKQASTLPYIYYYADTLNSFVVERVDGSNSRVPERTSFGEFDAVQRWDKTVSPDGL